MQIEHIQLTLPNQQILPFKKGITALEVMKHPAVTLQGKALYVKVNNAVFDLKRPIQENAHIEWVCWESTAGKVFFGQVTAYLLGTALKRHYPDAKILAMKADEKGFYCEVDFQGMGFEGKDLARIEAEMSIWTQAKISSEWFDTEGDLKGNEQGGLTGQVFQAEGQALSGVQYAFGEITLKVPIALLPDTGYIKGFKLLNMAGVYWQGNANQKQVTRIYGISFPEKALLKAYFALIEEAKKRDHRKLGASLEFFTFSDQVGLGLPLWLPKGAFLREGLMQVLGEKLEKAGFAFIKTPHIAHKNLYVTSGHYQKYSEDTFQAMHTPQKDEVFLLKSMNCPHHCQVYQSKPRSYKELPIRLAEFGTVYRYEKHGELHGLIRTRCFTQDDGHIFCMPSQIKQELIASVQLIISVFKAFGFEKYSAQISVRDLANLEGYIGSKANWDLAEQALVQAADFCGLATTVLEGEAAFYGPKIDFMVEDALGRAWQLGTVQLDYQLPQRFGLTYTSATHTTERPVMIHRAALGSLERFIGILLEHTGGRLPLRLCLEQVSILPIATKYIAYSQKIAQMLKAHGIRAKVDTREEKINRKIRDAAVNKTPYMLVIGEKEIATKQVAVRKQGQPAQKIMGIPELLDLLALDVDELINKVD
ncbi:MAG: threonine--tRNA ligase [Bacteroidota bacterium]